MYLKGLKPFPRDEGGVEGGKIGPFRQGPGSGIGLGTDPGTRPPLRFKYAARSINLILSQLTQLKTKNIYRIKV
jgi:hypothetical protein